MFSERIEQRAEELVQGLIKRRLTIVTAESCTGGLIAAALTSVPGSSAAVYGGFVTYSNTAKKKMISVPEMVLADHGAVSERTARSMAEGAMRVANTDIALSVTGIAGPGGGSPAKPVGLVHIGCASTVGTYHRFEKFPNEGRTSIREAAVVAALDLVLAMLLTEAYRTRKPSK